MDNCKGCKWLDTTRPPMALGYCMNPDVDINPRERARYEPMNRCECYETKGESEVVNNGR